MIWHSCQLNVLHFLFRHVGWSVGRSVGCRARAAGCNVRAHVATTRATQHMHPSRALFRVASKVPGIRSARYVEFRRIFATARQRTLSQLERDGVADGRLPNPGRKMLLKPANERKETLYIITKNSEWKYKARKEIKAFLSLRKKNIVLLGVLGDGSI